MRLSYLHELTENGEEKKRIEALGGQVVQDTKVKDGTLLRVNGELAVPRAIGDFAYLGSGGQKLISSDPFLSKTTIEDGDSFLLCCDGLAGPLSDAQIASILSGALPTKTQSALASSQTDSTLVDADRLAKAAELGYGIKLSKDNITVILALYTSASKESTEITTKVDDDDNAPTQPQPAS